ncbi:MAG TPA: hypothetical protein VH008_26910 [Pseudonocardia sp.]|jgi:NitT/TauT family transport system substrate-binding protein|nr:hypothetical protein [Pseudonocardia sp.]
MDELAISATANGLDYLPEYLAETTGLFRDAGLAVTSRDRDPWTGVLDDLDSGAADIALGGLWVPGMYAGSERKLTVYVLLGAAAIFAPETYRQSLEEANTRDQEIPEPAH